MNTRAVSTRRLVVASFCWLTALYAWIASSPFAHRELIQARMLGVGAFGDWHGALYALWLVAAGLEIRDAVRAGGTPRTLARVLALVLGAAGIALWIHPALPGLGEGTRSLVIGIAALAPVFWLALLDHVRSAAVFKTSTTENTENTEATGQDPGNPLSGLRGLCGDREIEAAPAVTDSRLFAAAIGTALFVAIASALLTPVAIAGSFEPDLLMAGLASGLFWNSIDQLVIGCAVFLVLALAERLSRRFSPALRYAICFALFTGVLTVIVLRTVCDALGMTGTPALAVAAALAASIVATWGSLRLRGRAAGMRSGSPLDVFFGPPGTRERRVTRVAGLAGLAIGLYAVGAASRIIDWDFLLVKCGVCAIWILAFDGLIHLAPRQLRVRSVFIALICLSVLGGRLAAQDRPQASRHTLDRYAVYNPAFRAAETVLDAKGPAEPSFDRFLRENTGLPDLGITPPDLRFTPDLGAAADPPFVFLFVIDSLRHDYLAPYNDAVTFTPRLKEFAADSIVFRNTFTRFGGTGLSVPAIWSGSAGIHRQYIKPFAPTNTLEKLLDANRYRRIMSVDVIMEPLLQPSAATTELDRGRRTLEYESCQTLNELVARLAATAGDPRPVFAYSLPQDLHVSNIISASVPDGASYPGFHAPYAARVQRIDTCFGRFIDFLKQRGWYDRSLIVVTADHGEMLGEEGLWGHVYYLFPPVIQVPLIMHLPAGKARSLAVDPDAVSLTTDITPTMYAALGYAPHGDTPLMGRPLIGPRGADRGDGRVDDYVLAASYSAVYAALRAGGRQLYIVDAVQHREYAYERQAAGAWHTAPVTPGVRETGQRLMRQHIYEIDRLYRGKARR